MYLDLYLFQKTRWDVQRIREQRHVARLKARYDPNEDHVITNLSSKLMPLNAESSKDFSSLTICISKSPPRIIGHLGLRVFQLSQRSPNRLALLWSFSY